MNRITFIEIAGSKYPLSFSLGASKAIAKKFGSLDKMEKIMGHIDSIDEETIDSITAILEVMIKQGCAYLNIFEKDMPPEKDAKIEEGKYVPLSQEEIEVGIAINDTDSIIFAITECVSQGSQTELEVETKNMEALGEAD